MTNQLLGPDVVRIDARTAIALVNGENMVPNAFRYVFQVERLTYEEQAMLSIVASQTFSWEGQATTTMTHAAGTQWLERGKGAIDRRLRDMEGQYLIQRKDEENGTISHWLLKNVAVQRALEKVVELKVKIAEVVALQMANPDDERAGADLVPVEVYYNIVAKKKERDADLAAALERAEKASEKIIERASKNDEQEN